MPSWTRAVTEIGRLLAALAFTLLLVTGLALLLAVTLDPAEPGRTARKLMVPLFALVYVLVARLGRSDLRRLLTWPPAGRPTRARDALAQYATAWAVGVSSLVPLVALLLISGAYVWATGIEVGPLVWRAVKYVPAGLVLVLLEEGLFRGLVQGRLRAAGGVPFAILAGSLLFAAGHFLRPPAGWSEGGVAGALDVVPGLLAGLGTIPSRWSAFLGLLLVGLVLAILRQRSGSLLPGMGVHAGWFWVQKMDDRLLVAQPQVLDGSPLLFGTHLYYDGIAGWCALALAVIYAWRLRRPAETDAPPDPEGNGGRVTADRSADQSMT